MVCLETWPVGVCSGRGTCVADACVCDAGYTGLGALIDHTDADCAVHPESVRVLYWIAVAAAIAAIGFACVNQVRRLNAIPERSRAEFWKAPLAGFIAWPNRLFVMIVGVSLVALTLSAVHAGSHPMPMIGRDANVTVLFLCVHFAVLLSGNSVCREMMRTFIATSKWDHDMRALAKRVESRVETMMNVLLIGLMPCACIVCTGLFLSESQRRDDTIQTPLAIAIMIDAILSILLTMAGNLWSVSHSIRLLEKHLATMTTTTTAAAAPASGATPASPAHAPMTAAGSVKSTLIQIAPTASVAASHPTATAPADTTAPPPPPSSSLHVLVPLSTTAHGTAGSAFQFSSSPRASTFTGPAVAGSTSSAAAAASDVAHAIRELRRNRLYGQVGILPQPIVLVFFIAWPFLRNRLIYVFPSALIAVCVMYCGISFNFVPRRHDSAAAVALSPAHNPLIRGTATLSSPSASRHAATTAPLPLASVVPSG